MTAATTASALPAERAASFRGFGWTQRQAHWLALVCLHSGVFTRRQYADCYSVCRQCADQVTLALIEAGIAREARFPDHRAYRPTGVCHVHARSLYRALGIENNRHRKPASPKITMRRLLSLDYVLEHQALHSLPTEPQKLAYFQRFGISVTTLPQRVYRGPLTDRSTHRYCALKLPIAGNGMTTTFVYTDTADPSPTASGPGWPPTPLSGKPSVRAAAPSSRAASRCPRTTWWRTGARASPRRDSGAARSARRLGAPAFRPAPRRAPPRRLIVPRSSRQLRRPTGRTGLRQNGIGYDA